MERKIKGAALRDIIKGIRAAKTYKDKFNETLSDEAKDLLNQRILTSIWYPYNLYVELYGAVIKIMAHNNLKMVIKWGSEFGIAVMKSVYKNLIAEGDINKLLEMYPRFHRMIYNFGNLTYEWLSDNEIIITLKDFDQKWNIVHYSNLGWTLGTFETVVKKKVNYEFLKKAWEGDEMTQYRLFWTP